MPFFLRRPVLLVRGAVVDRDEPDLARLRSLRDPERFAWAILPHVARSFAASVLFLPYRQALPALIGYLYTRIVDTYEDMVPDPAQRAAAFAWFATRFSTGRLSDAGPLVEVVASNPRQEVDRLLVERHGLVDRLYLDLPENDRAQVAALVSAMAANMQRWSDTFAAQGGVLETEQQLRRYCDDVIGGPARFAMSLVIHRPLTEVQSRRIATISEMVQLANVTRDIEEDLSRGIGYDVSLRPYVGAGSIDPDTREHVRRVREELLVRALRCVPAYGRLLGDLSLSAFSPARGSAVLLLLFTDRHYRWCAAEVGHRPWRGAESTLRLLAVAVVSVLSRKWARRTVRRVERNFLGAADAIDIERSEALGTGH